MKRNLIILVLGILASIAHAQEVIPEKYGMKSQDLPEGLIVGESAPNFEIIGATDEKFVLNEALAEGPIVLMFYRGNWCPYCSRYLAELTEALPEIKELGARLVAVTPESEAQIRKTMMEHGEMLTLIGDGSGEIMRAYDVAFEVTKDYQNRLDKGKGLSLKEFNDQEVAVLPVPATYIINTDGEIVYRFFDYDYSKRAPVNEILKVLTALN